MTVTEHERHRKVGIVFNPRCADCLVERPVVATRTEVRVKTRRARRSRFWLRGTGGVKA